MDTPTLQNVVSTVTLDCRLDLTNIAQQTRCSEYNPKRFCAVIMRIREPKTTALIFSSGKMVVTGAKSEENSLLAARKFAKIIQRLGYEVKFTEFKIQNIVASCDIKFFLRLETFAQKKPKCFLLLNRNFFRGSFTEWLIPKWFC